MGRLSAPTCLTALPPSTLSWDLRLVGGQSLHRAHLIRSLCACQPRGSKGSLAAGTSALPLLLLLPSLPVPAGRRAPRGGAGPAVAVPGESRGFLGGARGLRQGAGEPCWEPPQPCQSSQVAGPVSAALGSEVSVTHCREQLHPCSFCAGPARLFPTSISVWGLVGSGRPPASSTARCVAFSSRFCWWNSAAAHLSRWRTGEPFCFLTSILLSSSLLLGLLGAKPRLCVCVTSALSIRCPDLLAAKGVCIWRLKLL